MSAHRPSHHDSVARWQTYADYLEAQIARWQTHADTLEAESERLRKEIEGWKAELAYASGQGDDPLSEEP